MIWLSGWLVAAPSHWVWWQFALFVLASMAVAAFITGILMVRFAPDAPGSGIPQVKVAYQTNQLDFSWNLIWVKFIGGALSIGSGSSLGREGRRFISVRPSPADFQIIRRRCRGPGPCGLRRLGGWLGRGFQ